MKFSRMTSAGSLVVAAGLIAGAAAFAAPANADTTSDDFLAALSDAGLGNIDPANAVDVGQSICPMLAQPGQNAADAAAKVADAIGRSLGPATMFTGIAISMFCPGAVASLADGQSPIPLTLLGI
jgi:Protein of unknown function (DUF732)